MRIPKVIIILSFLLNALALAYLLYQTYRLYQDKQERYPGYYLKTPPNDSNEIIFIGDSHIEYMQPQLFFHNWHIKNRGIGGDVTEGVYYRLQETIENKPDKLFIEVGTNDILRGYSMTSIMSYYKKIVVEIKQKSPGTEIYVISIFPNEKFTKGGRQKAMDIVQDLNNRLKALCAQQYVQYIDVASSLSKNGHILPEYYFKDSLHLSARGNVLFRNMLKKYVDK